MSEFREDDSPPPLREQPVLMNGEGWSEGGVELDHHEPRDTGQEEPTERRTRRAAAEGRDWHELDPSWAAPSDTDGRLHGSDVRGTEAREADVEAGRRAVLKEYKKLSEAPPESAPHVQQALVPDGSPESEHQTIREAIKRSEANSVLSLAEAKYYAEDSLGVEYADFAGFDQQTANETNATLEALRARYPDVQGIRSLSTIQARDAELKEKDLLEPNDIDPRTIAEAAPLRWGAYSGIALNESYASDYERTVKDLQRQVAEGGHPPGLESVSGVITHEFGHVLANDLEINHPEIYMQEIRPVLDAIWSRGREHIRNGLAAYAASSCDELLAEAFAEYQFSSKPREYAKVIGGAIDRAYQRAYHI